MIVLFSGCRLSSVLFPHPGVPLSPTMLLRRCQSLNRSKDFAYVRAHGVSGTGRFLILNVASVPGPVPAASTSRFGIITTKRIGCAVVRNRLRRRVRDLLRTHAGALANGFYVVIILRKRASEASFGNLRKDLLHLIALYTTKQTSTPHTTASSC